MIYNLSCPSASFFAPLYSSHGVVLPRCILMSIFLDLACCNCVILVHLISMGPAVVGIYCRLGRMLPLPCRFNVFLEMGNLVLELIDGRLRGLKLRSELGIGCGQSCIFLCSDAVDVANFA
jgi:hypothetical protein